MTDTYSSFFDENILSFSIWQKKFQNIGVNLNNSEILLENNLYKRRKRFSGFFLLRYYVLYKQYLIYYQTNKKEHVKGFLDLTGIRVEAYFDPKTKYNGFRLSKNGKSIELFSKDQSISDLWYNQLRNICVNVDFHLQYEAIKLIGKGGFAKVYLAERKSDQKLFAVKALSKDKMLSQENGREALINEIEITKSLMHENTLEIYEIYESQTSIYIILELLKGGELLNVIKSKEMITEKQIKQIMERLLKILVYIHSKGIMHRDLKPDNLILQQKEEDSGNFSFKLVDFGLATYINQAEHIFKKCGTPGYVAPEVFTTLNGQYDSKCDIFSAGCILHQLFTGRVPFDCKPKDILDNNRKGKITILWNVLKDVSDNAKDLLKKMLEVNPQVRPSASELLKHPFFTTSNSFQENQQIPMKIENQITAYLKKIRNKQREPQRDVNIQKQSEMLVEPQSPGLESKFELRTPVLNGNISTFVESRRDSICPDSPNLRALLSKFATPSQFLKITENDNNNNNNIRSPKKQFTNNQVKQKDIDLFQRKRKQSKDVSAIYKYALLKNSQDKDKPNQALDNTNLLGDFRRRQSEQITQQFGSPILKFEQAKDDNSLSEYENIHLNSSEDSPICTNIKNLKLQFNSFKFSAFIAKSNSQEKQLFSPEIHKNHEKNVIQQGLTGIESTLAQTMQDIQQTNVSPAPNKYQFTKSINSKEQIIRCNLKNIL